MAFMSESQDPVVGEAAPDDVFETLRSDAGAALVDVRTRPEWAFVGLPDLSSAGKQTWLAEWRSYPDMRPNAAFMEDLARQFDAAPPTTLFFICRSGARSMEAARHAAEAFAQAGRSVRCVNVAEGFEGDLAGDGHRGQVNGWKARGLPWRQS